MVHVVYFLGDVLTYLAPDYWTIMACRFLVGVSHHTMSHLPYLLGKQSWIYHCYYFSVCRKPKLFRKTLVRTV